MKILTRMRKVFARYPFYKGCWKLENNHGKFTLAGKSSSVFLSRHATVYCLRLNSLFVELHIRQMFEPMLPKHENKSRRHVKSFFDDAKKKKLFSLRFKIKFILSLKIRNWNTSSLHFNCLYSSSRLRL